MCIGERSQGQTYKHELSKTDFLKRVNPKDINKLQLEGLVKAGAFDSINSNRQSLFNSIPNFITKSKNTILEALKEKDINNINNNNLISINGRDTLVKFRQFY